MLKFMLMTFALSFCFFPGISEASVRIVEDGRSSAIVVISDDATPTAVYAAEELVRHVEKATGAVLPVVSESKIPEGYASRIFIGDTNAARALGIDPDELAMDETVLLVSAGDLYIAGKESHDIDPLDLRLLAAPTHETRGPSYSGALFGVYEILERYLDAVWAWPGELGTYVPGRENIIIAEEFKESFAPELKWRFFSWSRIRRIIDERRREEYSPEDGRIGFSREGLERYGRDLHFYLRRHRQGWTEPRPLVGHEFHRWWESYGEEHPEWFMLKEDGERGPIGSRKYAAMCVSNPELHRFIIDRWREEGLFGWLMEEQKAIRLGEADTSEVCNCEGCLSWDAPQPEEGDIPPFLTPEGRRPQRSFFDPRWVSDRYARFWKTIYDMASEHDPDVVVTVYLYVNYFPAPAEVSELGSGILGEFVPWGDHAVEWFPMREDALEWVKEQWLGWADTGMTMAFRPNHLHDGWVMPHLDTRQTGEFFKFAYEHGLVGTSYDSLCGEWATQGPSLYLQLRLNAKPWMEVEQILDEYYSVFGPAEEQVREYFGYWEDYAYEHNERIADLYRDVGVRWQRFQLKAHEAYPPESFKPAEEILQRALEAAEADPDPEYLERVEFLEAGLEHAKLGGRLAALFDGERNIPRDSERFPKAGRALQELVQFRRKHEHLHIYDYQSSAFKERRFWNLESLFEGESLHDVTIPGDLID